MCCTLLYVTGIWNGSHKIGIPILGVSFVKGCHCNTPMLQHCFMSQLMQLILNSMQKYQPFLKLTCVNTGATQSFGFMETVFMAVTAYQNSDVSLCNNIIITIICSDHNYWFDKFIFRSPNWRSPTTPMLEHSVSPLQLTPVVLSGRVATTRSLPAILVVVVLVQRREWLALPIFHLPPLPRVPRLFPLPVLLKTSAQAKQALNLVNYYVCGSWTIKGYNIPHVELLTRSWHFRL